MTATPTIHLAVVRLMRPIVGGDSVPWSIARDILFQSVVGIITAIIEISSSFSLSLGS